MTTPLLSVLIASVPERLPLLADLVGKLQFQATGRDVEILALTDNRRRTIGEKRNALLAAARGEFVAFVDDDDDVSDDYVSSICDAILAFPEVDAIGFDAQWTGPSKMTGEPICKWIQYGIGMADRAPGAWPIPLQHVCPIRRSIAKTVSFPAEQKGEDAIWAAHVRAKLESALRIPRVLYHYRYDPQVSASRGRQLYSGAESLWKAVFESGDDERPEFRRSRSDALRMMGYYCQEKQVNLLQMLDVGAGRGLLGQRLPPGVILDHLDVVRPDFRMIHRHITADLATPDGRSTLRAMAPSGGWDIAACLHVLEHLPPNAVTKVLFSLAQVAKAAVFTISLEPWRWNGHDLRRTLHADWQWVELLTERWIIRHHEHDTADKTTRILAVSRQ
jgi:hypothetical protein